MNGAVALVRQPHFSNGYTWKKCKKINESPDWQIKVWGIIVTLIKIGFANIVEEGRIWLKKKSILIKLRDSQEFQLCGNGTFYSYILFSYGGLVKKGCGIKKFNAVSFFVKISKSFF